MMQALAELSVMYPVNGAFTMYICRFVDPSLGFAMAWEYAISWLTVLPFEISAACNIVSRRHTRTTEDLVLTEIADSLLAGIGRHQQCRLDRSLASYACRHPVLRN
jgi:amino acid permease